MGHWRPARAAAHGCSASHKWFCKSFGFRKSETYLLQTFFSSIFKAHIYCKGNVSHLFVFFFTHLSLYHPDKILKFIWCFTFKKILSWKNIFGKRQCFCSMPPVPVWVIKVASESTHWIGHGLDSFETRFQLSPWQIQWATKGSSNSINHRNLAKRRAWWKEVKGPRISMSPTSLLFYSWGNWAPEGRNSLPNDTWLIKGRFGVINSGLLSQGAV